MPDLRPSSITRETYPAMLAAGEPLYGLPCARFWRVVDTEADLLRAERELAAAGPLEHLRD
jgi:NDP-sugar pyrophosphorylase family protein